MTSDSSRSIRGADRTVLDVLMRGSVIRRESLWRHKAASKPVLSDCEKRLEKQADEGLAAYEKLLTGLVDVPAPDGVTPGTSLDANFIKFGYRPYRHLCGKTSEDYEGLLQFLEARRLLNLGFQYRRFQ